MEPEEFDAFYEGSFQRLVAQVYLMIGDWDEAQECVQEAFARAWSHRHRLDRNASPEAWVRTTACRMAVSRWRRVRLSRRSPDRALQVDKTHAAEPTPDHVALVGALRQIPEAQREALVLHHVYDMPVHDVASEVGVPVGTIKARLSRGRSAMLALLDDDLGFTEGATDV